MLKWHTKQIRLGVKLMVISVLKDWDQTPENIRNSSILGVTAVVDNPTITSEQIHQKWMYAKVAD